ncbi:hypothetical protein DFH29DRAFT_1006568 [Suillus ampliporus]|nr:hypothetical protein DFH29DRAFT_1006568 [Suillus ampliporus]
MVAPSLALCGGPSLAFPHGSSPALSLGPSLVLHGSPSLVLHCGPSLALPCGPSLALSCGPSLALPHGPFLALPYGLSLALLAQVLTDAYANLIQLDFDMIHYNEALNKRSTGRITKHEEALLHKFPYGSEQFLDKPLVLMDSRGCIILWYLPDAISPWIRAKMEEATVGMGYLLKKSMTSGQQTKWRTFSGYFHMSDLPPTNPRMHQYSSLLVLARPQVSQPHSFPPSGGFATKVSATLKGEGGLMSHYATKYAFRISPPAQHYLNARTLKVTSPLLDCMSKTRGGNGQTDGGKSYIGAFMNLEVQQDIGSLD